MVSTATARYQRISPRKARMIVNLIRGRDAAEALQLLPRFRLGLDVDGVERETP